MQAYEWFFITVIVLSVEVTICYFMDLYWYYHQPWTDDTTDADEDEQHPQDDEYYD